MFIENHGFDNVSICYECFNDADIKRYVRNNGVLIQRCNLCERANVAIKVSDPGLIRMVRALIRYYYPEYDYNGHWGGAMGPSELLFKSNYIIRAPNFNTEDQKLDYERIVLTMIEGSDSVDEIPLYRGRVNGDRVLFAYSRKTEGSRILKNLASQLESENYPDMYENYLQSLKPIFEKSKSTISKSNLFYRARIGFGVHKEKHEIARRYIEKKIPYKDKDIAAPPPKSATSGRANREGISYYYLASDKHTAVAEVRPHPGHYVTVGEFILNDNLNVVDLVECNLFEFSKSEREFENYVVLKELAEEFQKPITPDVVNRYLKSQFIADIAKNLGYDGISFNSSVAKGTNLVVFSKAKVKKTENDAELLFVRKQSYSLGVVNTVIDGFMGNFVERVEE